MFLPEGCSDPTKLRTIYVKHTLWARALARAAGEADSDEVKCNFNESKRRARDFFLKSNFSSDDHLTSVDKDNLPPFMKTVLGISTTTTSKLDLDANTASQIRLRKKTATSPIDNNKNSVPEKKVPQSRGEPRAVPPDDLPEEKKCEGDDMIASPQPADSPGSLAKKAASWGGDKDQLKILTGMGLSKP
mmetsp:Transcript_15137/g.24493  ORF Transcript_15137/g.24493 Transcript_15137/m.24493 type:complete len:189 (-) Transcript_15137:68-634(-)